MPTRQLQQLHGTMLEVQLEVLGSLRSVCGTGIFDSCDPDLGPALKILVSDPNGDFELLLSQSTWAGTIETSDRPGCDFRISLSGSPLSSRD